MSIAIIGAGNMGGAIARGFLKNSKCGVVVVSPNRYGELFALKEEYSEIITTTDNVDAVTIPDVEMVIVAVKPWLFDGVMEEIKTHIDYSRQMLVSVVAGVTLDMLQSYAGESDKLFRVIPNIAAAAGESMTFVVTRCNDDDTLSNFQSAFLSLGEVMTVDESQMSACTALSSCGIAYVFRFLRAATEAGVELGLKPDVALEIMFQTMRGAVSLLQDSGEHPEQAIDRVTTPGGMTIRGLNALEREGFTRSVIAGIKEPLKNQ